MIWEAGLLIVGIGLLLGGGQLLVFGASRLATSFGVSQLVIGLTVVAFGTSAPELAVNLLAALSGNTELAFGNVVGSNIANIGLVIGACAVARPLFVESVVISREIPMMLLASMAVMILGSDARSDIPASYHRADGLMLLLLFTVFLYYTLAEFIGASRKEARAEGEIEIDADAGQRTSPHAISKPTRWSPPKTILAVFVGLAILLVGAEVAVSSAVSIAERLGVSKGIVGLTVVAIGTSLPELTTSLIAAARGQTNLAVGNVVGSNIFNLLFVLGTTAAISPVHLPERGRDDLLAMLLFSILLVPLSRARGSHIPRTAGIALVLAYGAYMIWRLSTG